MKRPTLSDKPEYRETLKRLEETYRLADWPRFSKRKPGQKYADIDLETCEKLATEILSIVRKERKERKERKGSTR